MQSILQDMQTKPGAFQKYMSDASVASRIEKLIAAGVLRTGK